MLVPRLRFKEFTDEWKRRKLIQTSEINPKNSFLPKKFIYIDLECVEKGILKKENIINGTEAPSRAQRLVKINDILFQTVRPYQKNNYFVKFLKEIPYIASSGYTLIRTKENPYFIYTILHQKKFVDKVLNLCTGTSFPAISSHALGSVEIIIPTLKEQEKIGNFISLLDKKIELQSKKVNVLKLYKKGIKNKLLSNSNFEKHSLSEILEKWNIKNKNNKYNYVESISNKYGFISQEEQFSDRSVASKNRSNYYIVMNGIFAYNPSRLNVGSLALKKDNKISLISPLYECFKTNQNQDYLFEWFNSIEFKKGADSKFEGGVRNTLNFNNLCKINISLPSRDIQNKYADIFNFFNIKISFEEAKLIELIEFKKGLMQIMFV